MKILSFDALTPYHQGSCVSHKWKHSSCSEEILFFFLNYPCMILKNAKRRAPRAPPGSASAALCSVNRLRCEQTGLCSVNSASPSHRLRTLRPHIAQFRGWEIPRLPLLNQPDLHKSAQPENNGHREEEPEVGTELTPNTSFNSHITISLKLRQKSGCSGKNPRFKCGSCILALGSRDLIEMWDNIIGTCQQWIRRDTYVYKENGRNRRCFLLWQFCFYSSPH